MRYKSTICATNKQWFNKWILLYSFKWLDNDTIQINWLTNECVDITCLVPQCYDHWVIVFGNITMKYEFWAILVSNPRLIKAMEQGDPRRGLEDIMIFWLPHWNEPYLEGLWVKDLWCKVGNRSIKNGFWSPLVHGLKLLFSNTGRYDNPHHMNVNQLWLSHL